MIEKSPTNQNAYVGLLKKIINIFGTILKYKKDNKISITYYNRN